MFLLSSLALFPFSQSEVTLWSWPGLWQFQTSLRREKKKTRICFISNPFKTCHDGSTISTCATFILLVMRLLALFGPLLPFCQWRGKKCLLLVAQGDRLSKTCWLFHSLSPPSNPSLHLSVQPPVMDGASISSSLAWQSKKKWRSR